MSKLTTNPTTNAKDNLRGITLMCAAMLGFSIEDALIKTAAAELPAGQIIIMIGLIGATMMAILAKRRGHALLPAASLGWVALIRTVGEILGAICFVTAIVTTDLSLVSAILQATPLMVALGGALFLGQQVGWRRYSAILIGLFGVMLIVRPGHGAFEFGAILAVLAAFGLAIRDLAIRLAPPNVPSLVVAFQGMVVFAGSGLFLLVLSEGPQPVSGQTGSFVVLAAVIGTVSYLAIIAAMRVGEVAIVTPFRYTRLIFGMAAGIIVFNERPDMLTYLGASIVLATGLYTIYREQRQARRG